MSTEKEKLERGAIMQFQEVFNCENSKSEFLFQELRYPPEPDCLCSLNGEKLYAEIAHVYGTQSDVKQLLGRKGKSAASQENISQSTLIPLNLRLVEPLNFLLAEKSKKKYSASRVWLVIRSAFPLWEKADFTEHLSSICIPIAHPFEHIWLLCGPRSRFGLIKLA